jgi:2-dehydropantoate 2-reductase
VRFVVYGAGAVGGVIGGRLHQHGHDVVLIARGEHGRAIAKSGLRLETSEGATTLRISTVDHPAEVEFADRDVVLLCTKSQDTGDALRALSKGAPPDVTVACAQNGVENERAALRLFGRVYAIVVMLPASHLEPGVVQASSSPTTGILDVGRYPQGTDETARSISQAFGQSRFNSRAVEDIMRWKYTKLLMNLGNAVEVLAPSPARDELDALAREEGERCLRAAGIDFASADEERARRGDLVRVLPIGGRTRGGGSSWQSLARRAGSIEADYLNGEIVLLGRLHGVPAPVNELLRRHANRIASAGLEPGTTPAEELFAELGTVAAERAP